MRVGQIDIVPLSDGTARLGPDFYVGLDFDAHRGLLAADGTVHIPIGCYLVRGNGRVTLLDAGLGRHRVPWATGGDLPAALAAAGVAPGDVDTVVCSHLHIDHIGWLVSDGRPFFPRAEVRFGGADWEVFVSGPGADAPTRDTMLALEAAGRLLPVVGDRVSLGPGLTALHTPGHTPGHYCLVVASGDERAFLLGDAVECPLQIEEPVFSTISDVDPALAARTREALWRELEDGPDLVAGAHFPGLVAGRILRGEGRRWFTPAAAGPG